MVLCKIQKLMLTLQPSNIVEPFNQQRKGHANEYKVNTNPHRALVTATIWLQGIVVYQALIIILFYNNAGSTPA